MARTDTATRTPTSAAASTAIPRPRRADARRNYDKLIAAAREAFATDGTATSLEDIARRADVGIGTLYRNFPTRQHLLEAVYIEELEAIAQRAQELSDLPPWDALTTWLREYVGFSATKRLVAEELVDYRSDNPVFASCRRDLHDAGDWLVARAQASGVVRPDANFVEIVRMVSGIAAIKTDDPGEIDRILGIALDGLRYRPGA